MPEHAVALWAAAARGDWNEARAVREKPYPLAVAIYRDPRGGRATARLKACPKLLGRLTCDAVHPPRLSATSSEQHALKQALQVAGYLAGQGN
jgi:4-hydroxy-tetrahydrodipicolinate synthase